MSKRITLALVSFMLIGLVIASGKGFVVSTVLAGAPAPAYDWGFSSSNIPRTHLLPTGVTGFTDVAAAGHGRYGIFMGGGGPHALAVGNDGKLYAWGENKHGQLGNNTTEGTNIPVQVTLPASVTGIRAIAAGSIHSLALTNDGKLYAWGGNSSGQLGIGTTNFSTPLPTLITLPAGVTGFTAIAASDEHSLALTGDGKLYAWGANLYGQAGNGTNSNSNLPVEVAFPTGVTRFTTVTAGGSHSLATGNDGNLYAWGANANGQLGNGTNTDSNLPVAVTLPNGITSFTNVTAGLAHTLGLGSDGKYYGWGYNKQGQLGNGTNNDSNLPIAVVLPADVSNFNTVIAGNHHNLGLGDNGKLYAWGSNQWGQLGNGGYSNSSLPVQVNLPEGVTKFAAGYDYSVALLGSDTTDSNKKNKEIRPANLVAKLRVSPDREFSTSKLGEVLAYTLSLKNSGPGKAGQVYLTFPIAEGLEPGYTEFNRSDIWVEKVVLEGVDQPYMQIRYPGLESQVETEIKLYFRVKAGANPAEGSSFLSRFQINWSDEAKPANQRASNAVRVSFTSKAESTNFSNGEVQTFHAPKGTQLAGGNESKLKLEADFYAPDELVTFWYTDKNGKSTELVSSKADAAGQIALEIQANMLKPGEQYVVAGYGNTSGIYGSAVIQVAAEQMSDASYTVKPLNQTNGKTSLSESKPK